MSIPCIAFLAPGGSELLLILLALLLLFGPKDAPRMLRKLQQFLQKLKHMAADFQRTLLSSDPSESPSKTSQDTHVYDEAKSSPDTDSSAPPPPSSEEGPSS